MADDFQRFRRSCRRLNRSMREIESLMSTESDRGCALSAAALLDEKCEELLRSIFVANDKEVDRLLTGLGPLASFSARGKLLYALGILPEGEFNEITFVRKIRNEFAHETVNLAFETSPISDWVDKITDRKPTYCNLTRRDQYIHSIIFLLETLQGRIDTLKPLVFNNVFSTVLEVEQSILSGAEES